MRVRLSLALCAVSLAATALSAAPSPVADAAMKGDRATVKTLIQQKADVNVPQADGSTAIHWAAYKGDAAMADMLIAAGADVKKKTREGATPLYLAGIYGSAPMLDKLLTAGADANERGPQGETPLMLASRNGNVDAIKVLLDHKADINAKDLARGTTPLMWAAEQGHAVAMKFLIDRGALVAAASTPEGRNARNNMANPVSQRLNSGFGANGQAGRGRGGQAANGGGNGRGAAGRGRAAGGRGAPAAPAADLTPEELKTIAEQFNVDPALLAGLDPALIRGALGQGGANGSDGGGLTSMVYAARQDCLDCVKVLLEAKADVNQQTHYGWTALLTATQNRHYKIAAYLLDHGANPNLANNGGWTPLYLATDNRNIESGDYPVRTPDMDHLDYIKLLLAKGANVNVRICGVRSTAEQCTGDTTETRTNFTMQWLFEDGATPFVRAAQSGDVQLMRLLLEHGADPKIMTAHKVTALATAAGIGWVEGVTFEWSPKEDEEAVKMCLDLGIDPNIQDDEGRTSMHGAAHKGRPAVIQMLADHGGRFDIQDMGSRDSVNGGMLGQTWIPLDWARGLVRVGVQSAIPHPDAEKLIVKLMEDRGLKIPPPPKDSRCLTQGVKGCA
ncbi:MAG TPA: ankyrin repeat domain-containing protein [Bryobacteraceae bacterium]|jgi:ankyrin repeat protein